ncbi:MAG: hypothetical protein AVDCRST_MAG72-906, partial [uncultured Nocardioidaceae bacterium]
PLRRRPRARPGRAQRRRAGRGHPVARPERPLPGGAQPGARRPRDRLPRHHRGPGV